MLKYRINKLAQRRPGTLVLLPVISHSVGAEAAYLKAVRTLLRGLHGAVRDEVLPVVERERQQRLQASRLTQDVDSSTFERLLQLGNALTIIANSSIARILGLESKRHTKTFMATAKRTLGIDLTAVVREEDLAEYLETVATRNAGLIRGLVSDTIRRIQQTVVTSVLEGIPAASLRKTLVADFQFADKRAKVIARDQIAKVSSELNEIRHTQAGITEYYWRTSKDERVRPLHKKLDGRRYTYGKPTDAEQGRAPGRPILCRCIAQAIVEF